MRAHELVLNLISVRDFSVCLSGHQSTSLLQGARNSRCTMAESLVLGARAVGKDAPSSHPTDVTLLMYFRETTQQKGIICV